MSDLIEIAKENIRRVVTEEDFNRCWAARGWVMTVPAKESDSDAAQAAKTKKPVI